MTDRAARRCHLVFSVVWMTLVILAVRATATAHDTNPEHLVGLLPLAYMAAWCPYFLRGRGTPAQVAGRFVLCTASIAIGLGGFELLGMVGVVDYRALFATPTPPWKRPGNQPDPELLFVREGPAQTQLRFQGAEVSRLRGAPPGAVYTCDLELDRHGFRNPPTTTRADVVVIGDSFIEGLQVASNELVTTRLSQQLGRTVTNLGRTSYGPQQELEVLRRYGIDCAPRTCVWAFYEGNDLQDLGAYASQRAVVERSIAPAASRLAYERSFVRNALGYVIRDWIRPDPGLPVALYTGRLPGAEERKDELYFTTGVQHGQGGPDLPRGKLTPEFGRMLEILGTARQLCHDHGIDLVVAFLPSKFRIYGKVCEFDSASPCRGWPVDDLPAELASAIARTFPDVRFVDLTPAFLDSAGSGPLLFLADDTHWSAEGHRLAAEVIGGALQSRGQTVASMPR